MKNKYTIGRLLASTAAIFLITNAAAAAADKVVVIPLNGGSGDGGGVRTVMSAGQVWMDRNLGAHRAATKSDDSKAYGSLYQWGRLGDGHEYRESPVTNSRSLGDVPGHGMFIWPRFPSPPPYDWRAEKKDSLWQGESGINNPCPAGFRLPTELEWEIEKHFWGSNDAAGAFTSPLKLVVAGLRYYEGGDLFYAGISGSYWSSTVKGFDSCHRLSFDSGSAVMDGNSRANGMSVRCIKD